MLAVAVAPSQFQAGGPFLPSQLPDTSLISSNCDGHFRVRDPRCYNSCNSNSSSDGCPRVEGKRTTQMMTSSPRGKPCPTILTRFLASSRSRCKCYACLPFDLDVEMSNGYTHQPASLDAHRARRLVILKDVPIITAAFPQFSTRSTLSRWRGSTFGTEKLTALLSIPLYPHVLTAACRI